MLTSNDLLYMQSVEETAMASTAVINRLSLSPDGMGGFTESYGAVGTVICDIWPISRNIRENFQTQEKISQGEYYVSMPFDTDVTVKDRVVIDSISYEVTFVPKSVSWLTNLRIEVMNYNLEERL